LSFRPTGEIHVSTAGRDLYKIPPYGSGRLGQISRCTRNDEYILDQSFPNFN